MIVRRLAAVVVGALVATSAVVTDARADHLHPARVLPGSLSVNAQFVSQWFYGVIPPTPAQVEANLGTIADAGISVVRTSVSWPAAEPNPPNPVTGHTYDWSTVDGHMTSLARHGIRAEPLLIGTPWWDSPIGAVDPGNLGSHTWVPLHPEYYAAFTGAYAARFGRGGAFWAEHPELPELPPLTYEIWNEPNLNGRLTNAAGGSCPLHTVGLDQAPKHYTNLYVPARVAVRAADPDAIVMVGGLTGDVAPREDDRCTVQEFLAGMKAHDPNLVVDAIGIHVYRQTPEEVLTSLADIRRRIDDLVWPAQAPLYFNETGWVTPPFRSPPAVADAQRGANIAEVADRALRSNCGIREFAPHTWLTAEADLNNHEHWFGIANIDGSVKTSGAMYRDMVKELQGDGPGAANPATEHLCPWRGEPDIDGDGVIDSLDPFPADDGRSVDEPVVPEVAVPALLVVPALILLAASMLRRRRSPARGVSRPA